MEPQQITQQAPQTPAAVPVQQDKRWRSLFVVFALFLLGVFLSGLYWIFTASSGSPIGTGWFLFSFAAGLSMIVLPCTLPLAFVIVPLSMGKGYVKGLSVALAFGLGVAITLSMYGILAAVLGKALFGFAGGSGEFIKNVFYAIAGTFAMIFALGELGFIKARMPSYMGAAPSFIQNRKDITKALMLGLFLGNIGIGCPHPATPIILGQIGVTGDVFYGWLLFFVHAIGRVIPLLLLAILGILGVNATKTLLKHKDQIARGTAWGMVFVGAFLFTLGFFSHDWWVNSGQHTLLEDVTQEQRFTLLLNEQFGTAVEHAHGLETGFGFFGLPLWLGNWVFVFLMALPLWWYLSREKKRILTLPEAERAAPAAVYRAKRWAILLLTALLLLVFIYVLPQRFLQQATAVHHPAAVAQVGTVTLAMNPRVPAAGIPIELTFSVKDNEGNPLKGLEVSHERLVHAIIMSEDFQVFSHIHPEDFGPLTEAMLQNSAFPVTFTFPKEGRYLVSVNYAHAGGHEGAQQFTVDVGARGVSFVQKDFSRIKTFSDGFSPYVVSFSHGSGPIRSGEATTLRYQIEKDNEPVLNLQPYLGAAMHLAVVDAGLSSFTHTHGEVHDPATGAALHQFTGAERFGPVVEAHVTFPYPGLYQIFGQFSHQGGVITTNFMVEVEPGNVSGLAAPMPHGH